VKELSKESQAGANQQHLSGAENVLVNMQPTLFEKRNERQRDSLAVHILAEKEGRDDK
jgi:hypothetical protein